MSLFVVSSDWRFKDRFKHHFSYEYLHEFSMPTKLVNAIMHAKPNQELWVLADQKLGQVRSSIFWRNWKKLPKRLR